MTDRGVLILERPTCTEIDAYGNYLVVDLANFEIHLFDSDGIYRTSFDNQGESIRNAMPGQVYVSGVAEDGAPVNLKYRISTNQI